MPTTQDLDVLVTVNSNAQPVQRQSFDVPLWATPNVDVGFTQTHRIYESNDDVQSDVDLLAQAKAGGAAFFSQPNRPKRLAIGKGVLELGGGELATSLDAIKAVYNGWYGVAVDSRLAADVTALAEYAAPNDKLAIVQSSDAAIKAATPLNVFIVQKDAANESAAGMWHHEDQEFAELTWLAGGLSINLDRQSGVWYKRTLVGPTTSTDALTVAEKLSIQNTEGGNTYLPLKGVGSVDPGKAFSGKYLDEVTLKAWVKARSEEALAQYLLNESNANRKVPYNNAGFAALRGKVKAVLTRGEVIGHFNANSSIVTVPDIFDPLSGIDPADIENRDFPYMTAQATLTGGIRTVSVTIGLVFAA